MQVKRKHGLVGLWFHSYEIDKNKKLNWQGQIVKKIAEDVYLVQTYSWIDGGESDLKLVKLQDLMNWDFYNTDEEMRNAGSHKERLYP